MVIRSPKMLSAAEGQSCVNCGARDGTVVAAHYNGLRGAAFGRGERIKCHDLMVADLCSKCHAHFDGPRSGVSSFTDSYAQKVDHSEQFLFLVAKTWIRRIGQGVIRVEGHEPTDTDWLKQQLPQDSIMGDMLSTGKE